MKEETSILIGDCVISAIIAMGCGAWVMNIIILIEWIV